MTALRPSVEAEFATIVAELTRRGFLGGLAGGAAAVGLATCGSGAVGVDGKSEQYVVAAAARAYAGIPRVGSAGGDVDFERVAQLRPDLILVTTLGEQNYDTLAHIAPTVMLEYAQAGANWQRLDRTFAAAVGRTAALGALVHRYRARAAEVRTAHAATLATLLMAVVDGDPGTWYLYSPASSHGAVLADCGVRFVPAAQRQAKAFSPRSYEQLGILDGAGLLGVGVGSDGKPTPGTAQLLDQPGWRALPAVHTHRVVDLFPFFPVSYSSAIALVDELDRALTALETS